MIVLLQRVLDAEVKVDGKTVASIGRGILAYVGFEKGDVKGYLQKIAEKLVFLRIFPDEDEKMNLSLKDIGGELLLVPNFTLAADCRKGKRPSFQSAEVPDKAKSMFEEFKSLCISYGVPVKSGIFGADMKVFCTNDGPVNIILSSKEV